MIHFQDPTLQDRAWVRSLLALEGLALCSYSFPVLFCWKGAFRFQIARLGDRLLVRLNSSAGHAYLWPVGEGDPTPALEELREDAARFGEPLRLISLTRYHKNWLEDHYPQGFAFKASRDGSDYLYAVDRLADLPGKKLHAKRNHLHRFDEACPGWTWAPLTDADIPDCLEMDVRWHKAALEREPEEEHATLEDEHQAILLALKHRKELGLSGIILRWQGEVLGYSLGAPLTETVFDVNFERARGDIQGAYAAVNRSFARYVRENFPNIRYLDREEDMGVPGLRQAKLSYHPDYLQENYYAEEVTPTP